MIPRGWALTFPWTSRYSMKLTFPIQARKKRKPALDDLHKLLVTYHGLQQMQRELNEQLAVCNRQIAKHKFGSASGKSRRRRGRGRPYPRVKSPLRGVLRVEEDMPTFWGRVGEWLRRWWWMGEDWVVLAGETPKDGGVYSMVKGCQCINWPI